MLTRINLCQDSRRLYLKMSIEKIKYIPRFYHEQLLFSLGFSPWLSMHLLRTDKYFVTFVIFSLLALPSDVLQNYLPA